MTQLLRYIKNQRHEKLFDCLFNIINYVKSYDLTERDKLLLIETIKDFAQRLLHHKLGRNALAIDIDAVEVNTNKEIVAITLKNRYFKKPTNFEVEIALKIANQLKVPLFIEYAIFDLKNNKIEDYFVVYWVQKNIYALFSLNELKIFHHVLRKKDYSQLLKMFEKRRLNFSKLHEFI